MFPSTPKDVVGQPQVPRSHIPDARPNDPRVELASSHPSPDPTVLTSCASVVGNSGRLYRHILMTLVRRDARKPKAKGCFL
ncbi:uncharacterized protein VTP21DRAFT_10750 [Calcarisporiella thermophila]|uniref:uncharacterized protein n=1 Tax=Calcarisporiella thermophila TaxID=911321 RepID=UPI0037444E1F